MTRTHTPPTSPSDAGGDPREDPPEESAPARALPARLLRRITRAERVVAGLVAVLMLVLVAIEPAIVDAPFENWRTILFTVGATAVAAVALAVMLWFGVPPVVRIVVLWVPFAIVSWWLLSPYFVDDVVDEEFSTSIATELEDDGAPGTAVDPDAAAPGDGTDPAGSEAPAGAAAPDERAGEPSERPSERPSDGPDLLGAGQFAGLAGHSGTGDAGVFRNPDGSHVLRFENFDIQNGPDLKVYLVPGADQTSLAPGSIDLGALKGNIGDQTYDLPSGTDLTPGDYTALVWCEAFSVEFVAATLTIG